MMDERDIRMCVADVMQDDVIEDIAAILRMLNNKHDESSWRAARGQEFSIEEVTTAVGELLAAGMVTPCAETPPSGDGTPVPTEQVGIGFAIEWLWFHLEQSGRDAVQEWWNSVGQTKYPLEPSE